MSILWTENDLQTFLHFCLVIMNIWNKGTTMFLLYHTKEYNIYEMVLSCVIYQQLVQWCAVSPHASRSDQGQDLEKLFWASRFNLATIYTKVKASARILGKYQGMIFFAMLEYFFTLNFVESYFLDIWFPQESKVSPLLIVWIFLGISIFVPPVR
jgi:hypothetical protein